MASKDYNYFNAFHRLSEYSVNSAELLCEIFENYDCSKAKENIENMHTFEHNADVDKHEIMHRLAKEFITPIEREDIMQLCSEIDDVTDAVEDVFIRMYMFNVQDMRPDAVQFAGIILKCVKAVKQVLKEFPNYKKSTELQNIIIEVNRLEEEGDTLYTQAVHTLFAQEKDAVLIFAWKEVYDNLEKCCDACEHVANVVESIIMKNS